jgi:EAL domain-containing protein (putative c-di-GMP-specific phosphodiesterase class I)
VRLRAIGVDAAQGFAIHRPAPIEELLALRSIPSNVVGATPDC